MGTGSADGIDAAHHHCYHDAMERTTISLPEELLQRLRMIAAERRTSMAALVREALEEKARSYRPKPKSFGMGDSGYTDTSMRTTTERPEPRSWR
ncbi:MAG: ribbon-helix-helix protein, CopG family [Chloroflexi bacterium]|nr:ribbon-helix-helix protein, CopG family [Chloroflexota bacterium]